jgi:2-polyprenyl-3-methyl-5-hydroxy-6-metoxy-1,4-benzoquinol methylase
MHNLANRRTGDKIPIDGSYQYNAFYKGNRVQRCWHFIKLEEARRELAISGNDIVLDAGCGSGLLSFFLAKDSKADVWGIDANPSAIAFCRATYPLPNLHFEQQLIDAPSFAPGYFNKIVSLEVLEHLSPEQGHIVMNRFYELLRPGGKLVISTPNRKSLWPAIEFILDACRLVPNLQEGQHELLYSGKQLGEVAKQAGFDCISRKTINFIAPWMSVFGRKPALAIHNAEIKYKSRLGALLLYTFQKPGG